MVGGDQVRNSKPEPEIYQKAAQLLGVPVESCLALEDSNNGVRAAHKAGMFVIQIPDIILKKFANRKDFLECTDFIKK